MIKMISLVVVLLSLLILLSWLLHLIMIFACTAEAGRPL